MSFTYTKRLHIYVGMNQNNQQQQKYTLPKISLTPAKVITNEATNRSAIANDARNKFPILLKLRSV